MKLRFQGFVAGVIFVSIMIFSITVFAEGLTKQIQVTFNSANIKVNGKTVKVDNLTYNGTTYAPVRAVAQMLGKRVQWDRNRNLVNINDNGLGIKILQGNKTYDLINQEENITLKKEKFSIQFNVKKYDENNEFNALKIAAVPDENMFNSIEQGTICETSIFCPGRSMAGYGDRPFRALAVSEEAFHYIYYENEDSRRADLLGIRDDGTVDLEWKIDKVTFADSELEYKLSDIPVNYLYLIAFIDKNMNGITDAGEFTKIKITLQ